jgi:hypothetical protein
MDVEPTCVLYVEDATCCEGGDILTGKPYAILDIACSEYTHIPPQCISVEGESLLEGWRRVAKSSYLHGAAQLSTGRTQRMFMRRAGCL